jgi:hypothetical protein
VMFVARPQDAARELGRVCTKRRTPRHLHVAAGRYA